MKRLPSANVKREPVVSVKHSLRSHEAKRPYLSVRRSLASFFMHRKVRFIEKSTCICKCFFMVE